MINFSNANGNKGMQIHNNKHSFKYDLLFSNLDPFKLNTKTINMRNSHD